MAPTEHRNFAINTLHVPAALYDKMQSDNAARREGREAAYAGKTEGANPFCPDETEHAMWAHGFAKARDEMAAFGIATWLQHLAAAAGPQPPANEPERDEWEDFTGWDDFDDDPTNGA